MNIIITGASRGIGRAIALEFGKLGWNVFYLFYNKSRSEIFELRDELQNKNNIIFIHQCDINNRERIKGIVKLLSRDKTFNIDCLINNAGMIKDRTLKNMTDEEWDNIIGTNLTGIYNITKAFLPYMNSGGCIINITSIIGLIGGFGQCNYAASKAGVIGFTKALAKELAKRNIRVNAIACGYVDTDMTKTIPVEYKQKIIDGIPLKRFATAEEIAKFVKFIALKGTYCTGQVYVVDGGLT